ncbi:MAG TPA: hypothetical protein VH704_09680 [Casimicrobiaceae bacterium]|nr:hypothetical protein [Casimicrobiaceae bacterium]
MTALKICRTEPKGETMTTFRRAACVLLAAASFLAPPAQSTSFGTDQSDLYYIPAESGWGVQLVQRGSVIFATMFVFGADNTATWYVATLNFVSGSTWTGDLYTGTGPYFGTVPFNPLNVVGRKAGTMTWVAQTLGTGTLSYVADGVAVTKNVIRQTLVVDDYSGTYMGAFHFTTTACTDPSNNGSGEIPLLTITITQTGQSISIGISILGVAGITISGMLSQSGQFGAVLGTYTDTTGDSGTASVSALNVQTNAIAGTFSQSSAIEGCQTVGYFAGMRSRP